MKDEVDVINGHVYLEGMQPYQCQIIALTSHGLSIRHYENEDDSRFSENGPNFSFDTITSRLFSSLLHRNNFEPFSNINYDFSGSYLGSVRAYSGYTAAADGGDSRPIEKINMLVGFSEIGLSVLITGQAGNIDENDCLSREQQFIKKQFSVSFDMAHQNIPYVIDVRSVGNHFEKKFLGNNEQIIVFPKLR